MLTDIANEMSKIQMEIDVNERNAYKTVWFKNSEDMILCYYSAVLNWFSSFDTPSAKKSHVLTVSFSQIKNRCFISDFSNQKKLNQRRTKFLWHVSRCDNGISEEKKLERFINSGDRTEIESERKYEIMARSVKVKQTFGWDRKGKKRERKNKVCWYRIGEKAAWNSGHQMSGKVKKKLKRR